MTTPKRQRLFWGSSYDRGLDVLLAMWPAIKKAYPKATLDICYGWDLFDKAMANNKERQAWKAKVQQMMEFDGITHHGRVGKERLAEIRKECGVWAYPTYFTEINCITALDSQMDGLVPVTMTLGALKETAKEGCLIDGDIKEKETREQFLKVLLQLMGNQKVWKSLSRKVHKFACKYEWANIAGDWAKEFIETGHSEKVTVFTPTIRNGWWNVMASNLASQTHKNFEWIIVDGQEKSRKEIADKYAKEYDLDIKYIYQGKTKRTYGLSQANNLAINAATGYLFVFLQDFVLLTPTALEELLNVSLKHPGDFIAPVDTYFSPRIKPNVENKEDWFDGSTNVIGEFMRKNIRITNEGIRKSEVLTDFEQNFGAVPVSTLRHLNGYWEFYDEALGWDDTEIIYRAKALGYGLWIDDTNRCICIDHWSTLGKDEGGTSVNRTRRLNDPRYVWMVSQIQKGNLPIVREVKLDKSIDLQYTIPESVPDDECVQYVRSNIDEIVNSWGDAK